ncbi:hypothetical protein FB45DRAFT_1026845 [Roridomyces roridus]|uniref:Uncharacterized protein n=1 Tax=Roridomyces roridus TaxID=1738132 RepID=A0AAD7BWL9_9AGAR|nr:hypothetical protein FB45DRAFT_1026845 [Roridomyces roridus]
MSNYSTFIAALSEANAFLVSNGGKPIAEAELRAHVSHLPEAQKPEALERLVGRIPKTMSTLGVKPTPDSPQAETSFIKIPNDKLCIRFFPGGAPPTAHSMFFDFYDLAANRPVNTPAGYTLRVTSPAHLVGQFGTVEAAGGYAPNDGGERFAVATGVICLLERPNHPEAFEFQVPPRAGVAQAVPARFMSKHSYVP